VEVEAPSEAISGSRGTEFELTFESDTAGTGRVRLNGTTPTNGSDITDAVSVEPDSPVTLSFVMDGNFAEGANELRVVVTDSDGDVGQDILTVTKDDPPSRVTFVNISQYNDDPRIARGNQSLRLVFRVLDEPDIEKYVVFFDEAEFSADDWDGCDDQTYCGPKYSASGGPESPMVITEWSGSTHEVDLSPLQNGTQYWIAVRAYDEGGKEGAMSAILTGKPEAGLGPAELAEEQGGFQCSTTAASAGLLGAFGAFFAIGRRRRRRGIGAGLAMALMVGGAAEAKDPDAEDSRKGTFQFRYGIFQMEDTNITKVMGDSGNEVLWMEVGPHIIPQVEVTAGVGWFQEIGNPILATGGRSDDNVELTALPLNLSLNLRGDFWKNQPVVPAIGASIEMWNWKQEPYGGTSAISGSKTGWSWNAGLQILLDRVDPQSASKLRVRTGIDDTYLTLTYREQTIGENASGLIYSGSVFGFGLKLDY
jgi:MYXO-CTERM domain-containing protein